MMEVSDQSANAVKCSPIFGIHYLVEKIPRVEKGIFIVFHDFLNQPLGICDVFSFDFSVNISANGMEIVGCVMKH